jgi:hypothetical protein
VLNSLSDKKEFKEIDNLIFEKVGKSIDCFIIENMKYYGNLTENIEDSGYTLRKIIGPTKAHQDGIEIKKYKDNSITYRVATLIISLAGTGDTLIFKELGINIPIEEGMVVFFPPYWTHIHSSEWSGTDTYRIQTWLTNRKKYDN